MEGIGDPDLNQLDAILRKYTSSIPSAVYVNKPDIPLYDHAKTTAAIASCLYLAQRETKPFLLIEGDLSGIQDFIFGVSSPKDARKGMAKRLRGRSFWLGLLTRAVSDDILQKTGLSRANLLWNTGGKFVILLPNTTEVQNILSVLTVSVNQRLLERYQGRLYLSVGMIEFGKDRFSERFDLLLGELSEILSEKKLQKFSECSLSFGAEGEVVSRDEYCNVCGSRMLHGECKDCEMFELLGQKIASAEYLLSGRGNEYSFDFSAFGLNISYDLSDSQSGRCVYHINDTKLGKNISGFMVMGNTVPKHGNDILTFGDIANLSKGDPKLSVFKADMDRLGKVMGVGLPEGERSISRIHTLSSRLELFFCGMVNELCAENPVYDSESPNAHEITLESGKMVRVSDETSPEYGNPILSPLYIVYAGGDDLLIVGPYDRIILFADTFYRKFREYVCNNPDLTISAGIAVAHPRLPITFSVRAADELLDRAKSSGRDRVCVFGECLRWNALGTAERGFADLLCQGMRFEEYVQNGTVSRSFVNSLVVLWCEHFGNEPVERRVIVRRYLPQLMYMMKRNVFDTSVREEMRSNIAPAFGWMQMPIQWVLMRTRRV